MTLSESKELENHLLSLGKEELMVWLNQCSEGEVIPPSDCDINWWTGLSYTLASRSQSIEPWDLDWAKIAIAFYEHLKNPTLIESSMAFRLNLIRKFGAQEQKDLLNPQIIVQWFERSIQLRPEDALQISQQWRADLAGGDPYAHVSNDSLLEIRTIKNKLNIVKELISIPTFQPTANISHWIEIQQQLV
jgi:hypothetical protein